MLHPPHYDPLQPRVPKGHEGGGQWMREGEHSVQLAFLDDRKFRIKRPGLAGALDAALELFAFLSGHNSRRRQAFIDFNAYEYSGKNKIISAGKPLLLTPDEVENVCRFKDVQELIDKAAKKAGSPENYGRPSEYGTAVHSHLKKMIDKKGDPDLRAEVSYVKSREESYGSKESIRIDVLERVSYRTVCVFDLKTGRARLRPMRMAEIAKTVFRVYPKTRRIIVTEVRPTPRR